MRRGSRPEEAPADAPLAGDSGSTVQMRRGSRPEEAASAPSLYSADSLRYHLQNAVIQLDMAELAVGLAGLSSTGSLAVVADLGCGSGLSAASLRTISKAAWVGFDITPEMLRIAASESSEARGHLALVDLTQGLPLRSQSLNGAISISAVQWLCSNANPQQALSRLFADLHRALKPGACAALQVYVTDDEQAQQLSLGARACGLNAGFFVSFPHSNSAKKFFVLVQRPPPSGLEYHGLMPASQGSWLSSHNCNLAWPKRGSCILSWVRYVQQQAGHAGHAGSISYLPAINRMQREHAGMGKRMLRLMRRAESLTAGDEGAHTRGDAATMPADISVVQAELEMIQPALMPCGGAIYVQITAAATVLHKGSRAEAAGSVQQAASLAADGMQNAAAAAAGCTANDPQHLLVPAVAMAKQLLQVQAGSGSSCGHCGGVAAHASTIKVASPDDSAAHLARQPEQLFPATPANSTSKAAQFMRLEPLQLETTEGRHRRRQDGQHPVAAVLHPHKLSQLLLVRLSAEARHNKRHHSSDDGSRRSDDSSTWSSAGSDSCSRFCSKMNACVIVVDAHLRVDQMITTTWVLHVSGLQDIGRSELSAAVLHDFALV